MCKARLELGRKDTLMCMFLLPSELQLWSEGASLFMMPIWIKPCSEGL